MDAIDCIKKRRSIRKFLDKQVSKEILTEVIATACWSPSYKNSQPWEVMVLSGAKKLALSNLLISLLKQQQENCPDIAAPQAWPPAEAARIDHLYQQRREATGIDLTDPAVIAKAKEANFNFYGAPHAIYLYQDKSLSQWSLFDLGLFAQSLMLAAQAHGLGTVPQAFTTDYAQDVKKFLGIPASKRLVLGIAIGYPDLDSPANALRTDRAPLPDFLTWQE